MNSDDIEDLVLFMFVALLYYVLNDVVSILTFAQLKQVYHQLLVDLLSLSG